MLFVANREKEEEERSRKPSQLQASPSVLKCIQKSCFMAASPRELWKMLIALNIEQERRVEDTEDDSSSARQVSGSEAITKDIKNSSGAAAVKRSVYDSLSLWNLITFHQEHKLLCANVWAERFFQFWVNLWHSKPRYSFSAAEGEFQTERQKIIMRESLREIYDEWELDSRSK